MGRKSNDRQLPDDALAIDRAKAIEGKQTEYRIAAPGLRGFTLRVEPTGHATYWVRYSRNKAEKRMRVGVRGLISYKDAKLAARKLLLAVDEGADPAAEKKARETSMTFAELWERRKADNLELTAGTIANYEGVLNRYVLCALGTAKAAEISQENVSSVLDAIRDSKGKLRRNPYNGTLTAISSTFTWARGKGMVLHDPTEHLRPLPPSKPRKRSLTDDELGRLWSAIGHVEGLSPKTRIALRVLLLTGQRNSNITAARVDWIKPNLEVANPILRVPAANMKVKTEDHLLPLVPSVVSLLKEAVALDPESEFIFASDKGKDGHISRFAVPEAMQRVCEKAELQDVHAHDFRHLQQTWLAERQIPKDVRDKITHHSVSRIEHTYNSAKLHDPVRRALQAWADHVEAVAGEANQPTNVTSISAARSA